MNFSRFEPICESFYNKELIEWNNTPHSHYDPFLIWWFVPTVEHLYETHITHSLISLHMSIEMCSYWHWCHWVEGYLVFSIQSFSHLLLSLFPYYNNTHYLFLMSSMKGDLMNQPLMWLLFIESVFLKLNGFVEMILRSALSSPLRAHIPIISDWSLGRSHSSFLSLSLLSITASWQYSPTLSPNMTVVREGRSRFSFYSIN